MANNKDLDLNWGDIAATVNRVENFGNPDSNQAASHAVKEKEKEFPAEAESAVLTGELEQFADIFRNARPAAPNERMVSAAIPRYQRDMLYNLAQWLRSNVGGMWTIAEVQRVCLDYFFAVHPEASVEIERMRELRLKEEISAMENKLKELKRKKGK